MSRRVPLPIRFTVVSWPATKSSSTIDTSSFVESRSPSSSAAMSADSKSFSRGALRRSAITASTNSRMWPDASVAACRSSAVMSGSSVSVIACDHARQLFALVGRHAEQLGDDLERQRERERRDQVAPTVGRDRVEDLVDHLDDTGAPRVDGLRRERAGPRGPARGVCFGGSRLRSDSLKPSSRASDSSWLPKSPTPSTFAWASMSALNLASRSTLAQSSYRVRTTSPKGLRCTGSTARSSA